MKVTIGDGSRISIKGFDSPDKYHKISTVSMSVGGSTGPTEDFVETTGPQSCGSIVLGGNANSYIQLDMNGNMNFGTNPFTIEWWQYQTDNNAWPRVFARGSYGSSVIGFSNEGGSAYFWSSGAQFLTSIYNYKNTWLHFAITRSLDNKLRFFINGDVAATVENYTYDFSASSAPLMIGVEGSPSNGSSFGGNITNFHVMNGAARYTKAFTPSTSPLKMTNKSVLMLYAVDSPNIITDSTGASGASIGPNISWSSANPF